MYKLSSRFLIYSETVVPRLSVFGNPRVGFRMFVTSYTKNLYCGQSNPRESCSGGQGVFCELLILSDAVEENHLK